eukprot:7082501-Pyramimonas_sp.AAC.1
MAGRPDAPRSLDAPAIALTDSAGVERGAGRKGYRCGGRRGPSRERARFRLSRGRRGRSRARARRRFNWHHGLGLRSAPTLLRDEPHLAES